MMKYKNKILLLVIVVISFLCLSIVFFGSDKFEQTPIQKKLSEIDLKNINKLMIIVHPDDETLWGGAQLINHKYLVICITCGSNEVRNNEFKKVMDEVNSPYISLSYPDKTNGKRDDWHDSYIYIQKDLKDIINYKNWGKIVTHNPEGEYGHEQHIMTSDIVTSLSNKEKLYYFNDYFYDYENLSNDSHILNEKTLKKKIDLLKIYKSQTAIINNHYHTIKYKELTSYEDWENNKKKYVCN